MAARVERRKGTKPAPQGAGSVNGGTDMLHPDRSVEIAGKAVRIREYGHVEGMEIESIATTFFADLYALAPRDGAAPRFEGILDVMVRNWPATTWMKARAISPPPPFPDDGSAALQAFADEVKANERWIRSLSNADGDNLQALWWMVNAGFFTRRLLQRAQIAAASPSPGPASTTPSSVPDSDEHPMTLDGLQPDR